MQILYSMLNLYIFLCDFALELCSLLFYQIDILLRVPCSEVLALNGHKSKLR